MNLLLYTPNYYPATRYGGPVRSTHGLARALVRLGHEVRVFTTNVDGAGTLDVPLGRPVERDGVAVSYFPVVAPRRVYRSPMMAEALATAARWADGVHINGVFLHPGPAAAGAARRAGTPYVLAPRGMLVRELIAARSALVKRAWLALIERRALAGAAAIHVTSPVEATELAALGLRTGAVALIPNGVEPPATLDRGRGEALWAGAPAGRRVAFLARLDWKKGVDLAVDAALGDPRLHLRLAGPDEGGLRAGLEAKVAAAGAAERVRFVGPLEDGDKFAFLAAADAALVPSINESFGMVVAEALAVGTPTVVTEGVGARVLVEALDPALVVPRGARAIGAALAGLLADPARCAALGRAYAAHIAEHHGWSAVAQEVATLFAANGPARVPARSAARAACARALPRSAPAAHAPPRVPPRVPARALVLTALPAGAPGDPALHLATTTMPAGAPMGSSAEVSAAAPARTAPAVPAGPSAGIWAEAPAGDVLSAASAAAAGGRPACASRRSPAGTSANGPRGASLEAPAATRDGAPIRARPRAPAQISADPRACAVPDVRAGASAGGASDPVAEVAGGGPARAGRGPAAAFGAGRSAGLSC